VDIHDAREWRVRGVDVLAASQRVNNARVWHVFVLLVMLAHAALLFVEPPTAARAVRGVQPFTSASRLLCLELAATAVYVVDIVVACIALGARRYFLAAHVVDWRRSLADTMSRWTVLYALSVAGR
jgi:hypothetical protein